MNHYHNQNQANSLADCSVVNLPRGPPVYLRSRKYERLKEDDKPDSDNVIDFFSRKGGGSGEEK